MARYKLGYIGVGNMGAALAGASCAFDATRVVVANRTPEKADAFARRTNCAVGTMEYVARESEYVLIGTLPGAVGETVRKIYPVMKESGEKRVLVSMAGGVSLSDLAAMTDPEFPIIRIMPNTPVAVGKGLVFYACNDSVDDATIADFVKAMAPAGSLDPLPENLFNAGSAVAGCGPAFAALFIEALADGGVKAGLPRDKAVAYAEKMLLGTAELALRTGKHPGQIKDEVASPGGSTIEGIQALEEGGFRAAAMRAVVAAWEKHK
jgi:pyrroline-5-carboxylate reductase